MMYAVLYRSLFALLLSFGLTVGLGILLLPLLRSLYSSKADSEKEPAESTGKSVPSMGGIVIFVSILVASFSFGHAGYRLLLPALIVTGAFASLGFADDFIGVMQQKPHGLLPWQRIAAEVVIALGFGLSLYFVIQNNGSVWLNALPIGMMYILFASVVSFGTVNVVRYSNEPNGAVTTTSGFYALFLTALLCIAVVCAPTDASAEQLLNLSSLSVFAAATAGASLGFLLFDAHPARLLMGSTGLYTLSGAIAGMALLSGTALLLPLMCICLFASAGTKAYERIMLWNAERNGTKSDASKSIPNRRAASSRILSVYGIVTIICSAAALLIYWFLK